MSKRAFDFLASLVGLALLAIPLGAVALAIIIDDGRPVLFRQTRVGLNGREFSLLKFRTMVVNAEADGRLSVGKDRRITGVGRALRRYKLDELPQLLNVLLGEMSLVGPRPEVPEYAHVYPEQERVWSVRPGITDPTSIELYDESEILARVDDAERYYVDVLLPQKTRRYLAYIDSHSFLGDIGIILRTFGRVLHERTSSE